MSDAPLLRLSDATPGTKGAVAEIRVTPESKTRLLEMGLLIGTKIEVVRFAPMGDPIEIKVRGYNLTLRKHEASEIYLMTA